MSNKIKNDLFLTQGTLGNPRKTLSKLLILDVLEAFETMKAENTKPVSRLMLNVCKSVVPEALVCAVQSCLCAKDEFPQQWKIKISIKILGFWVRLDIFVEEDEVSALMSKLTFQESYYK